MNAFGACVSRSAKASKIDIFPVLMAEPNRSGKKHKRKDNSVESWVKFSHFQMAKARENLASSKILKSGAECARLNVIEGEVGGGGPAPAHFRVLLATTEFGLYFN